MRLSAATKPRCPRAWLANPSLALAGIPVEQILTVAGLLDVIAYPAPTALTI